MAANGDVAVPYLTHSKHCFNSVRTSSSVRAPPSKSASAGEERRRASREVPPFPHRRRKQEAREGDFGEQQGGASAGVCHASARGSGCGFNNRPNGIVDFAGSRSNTSPRPAGPSCGARLALGHHGRRQRRRPPVSGILHREHPEPEHAAPYHRACTGFFRWCQTRDSHWSGSGQCTSRPMSRNSRRNSRRRR